MLFTEFNIDDAKEVWYEEGRIRGTIEIYAELNGSKEECIQKLIDKFSLFKEEAEELVEEYWK